MPVTELLASDAVTSCRPGTGFAQMANAVTDQVAVVPLSSSEATTIASVSVELGVRSSITACPVAPVSWPPVPISFLPAGQKAIASLTKNELSADVAVTSWRPGTAADAVPANAPHRTVKPTAITDAARRLDPLRSWVNLNGIASCSLGVGENEDGCSARALSAPLQSADRSRVTGPPRAGSGCRSRRSAAR